jgi:amino-acid N-acetyltransferase
MGPTETPRPLAFPLAPWERDGLAAALAKANLPIGDIREPDRLFWRFEHNDIPVGFGGLEIHGKDALLRSIVTLPPVRRHGIGSAIVAALETEARIAGCRTVWLLTTLAPAFFEALGYTRREHAAVPEGIRGTQEFAALCPADATVMMKALA